MRKIQDLDADPLKIENLKFKNRNKHRNNKNKNKNICGKGINSLLYDMRLDSLIKEISVSRKLILKLTHLSLLYCMTRKIKYIRTIKI